MLIFITLGLFLFAVSCSPSEPEQNKVTNDIINNSQNDENVPEIIKTNAMIIKEKYGDLDYGGAEIKILSPQPGAHFYGFSNPTENEL